MPMCRRREHPAAPVAHALELQLVEQARSRVLTVSRPAQLKSAFSPVQEAVMFERSMMMSEVRMSIFPRLPVVSLRLKVAGSICL